MFIVCIQLVDVRNGKTQTISGDGGEPDCCSAMREWTGRDTESVKIADFGSGQARLECPCSMGRAQRLQGLPTRKNALVFSHQ